MVSISRLPLKAFSYYGGKFSKLDFILPQLETPHAMYCELFAGSLAVLLNKIPCEREVVNDMAEEVVDFWRCLRERKEELLDALDMTPPGETEYMRVVSSPPTDDLVERARRFFVIVTQSFNNHPAGKNHSLRGFIPFNNSREMLPVVAKRMRQVVVENRDAVKMLRRLEGFVWGGKKFCPVLIYADPPYTADSRSWTGQYIHDDFNHEEFLDAVIAMPSYFKIAISGYPNPLYDKMFDRDGWHRVEFETANYAATHRSGKTRTEVLWRNYILSNNQQRLEL